MPQAPPAGSGHRRRARRGISLLIVMVALSMSLVLSYGFLRTQSTVLQISHNGSRRDLALQAAQTGAAVALERMQSPDWQGVTERPTNIFHSDEYGSTVYDVQYLPLSEDGGQTLPEDAALMVQIASTGIWESNRNPNERVERGVEVVARLQPRLPGRPIRPEDSATASDLVANPADYDDIQAFALYADGGRTSLELGPGARIEGDLFLDDNLHLFHHTNLDSTTRAALLGDIGSRFVSNEGQLVFRHPHSLAGSVTFDHSPSSSAQADMSRAQIPWTTTDMQPNLPSMNFSDWTPYRLYDRGFEYNAVSIGSTLQNVTLRPSPDNPLGIFYNTGPVTLYDNVTIQGTLVSTGLVTFAGNDIQICSRNWRGDDGSPLVTDIEQWPRLPAIIADGVWINPEVQATVTGAVAVAKSLAGGGGIFEFVPAADVNLAGTATSRPLRQPWSLVQLDDTTDVTVLNSNGDYSIWLADGPTGSWHEIVGVDTSQQQLTVIGEVTHDVPTNYVIRRTRKRYFDLYGPVSGDKHDIEPSANWKISNGVWDELHDDWTTLNDDRAEEGLPPIFFTEWLEDPANFAGWPYPYSAYGLKLEPTCHLRNTEGIAYQWSPPLFTPYQATGADEQYAGYRWKVVSWRELP